MVIAPANNYFFPQVPIDPNRHLPWNLPILHDPAHPPAGFGKFLGSFFHFEGKRIAILQRDNQNRLQVCLDHDPALRSTFQKLLATLLKLAALFTVAIPLMAAIYVYREWQWRQQQQLVVGVRMGALPQSPAVLALNQSWEQDLNALRSNDLHSDTDGFTARYLSTYRKVFQGVELLPETTPRRIPRDVWGIVLGYLKTEQDVRNAARVCKAWRMAVTTRFNLFQRKNMDKAFQLYQLLQNKQMAPLIVYWSTRMLEDFLEYSRRNGFSRDVQRSLCLKGILSDWMTIWTKVRPLILYRQDLLYRQNEYLFGLLNEWRAKCTDRERAHQFFSDGFFILSTELTEPEIGTDTNESFMLLSRDVVCHGGDEIQEELIRAYFREDAVNAMNMSLYMIFFLCFLGSLEISFTSEKKINFWKLLAQMKDTLPHLQIGIDPEVSNSINLLAERVRGDLEKIRKDLPETDQLLEFINDRFTL